MLKPRLCEHLSDDIVWQTTAVTRDYDVCLDGRKGRTFKTRDNIEFGTETGELRIWHVVGGLDFVGCFAKHLPKEFPVTPPLEFTSTTVTEPF
jgi:hypothetical protein